MAKKKVQLQKDYTNWFSIAGDLYRGVNGWDAVQAQRMAFDLQAANPGVSRFHKGMSIKMPVVKAGYTPYISHEQMRRARGETQAQYAAALAGSRSMGGGYSTAPAASAPTFEELDTEGFTVLLLLVLLFSQGYLWILVITATVLFSFLTFNPLRSRSGILLI